MTYIEENPYKLWNIRKSNISYFYIIGYKYFILNNAIDNLEKFDTKSDEDNFLGYSLSSKVYRVFNKRTLIIEESIHIVFDETNYKSLKKKFYWWWCRNNWKRSWRTHSKRFFDLKQQRRK